MTLRLLRKPEAVRTLLAAFEGTDQAGDAVSRIIGAGIVPAAIEMMDALAMEAAEAAVHVHYPEGAGAVLVVELDGPEAEVAHQFDEVERLCQEAGSTTIQIAESEDQRRLPKGEARFLSPRADQPRPTSRMGSSPHTLSRCRAASPSLADCGLRWLTSSTLWDHRWCVRRA